jgi:prolyl 4-hydroxylase
MKGRFYANIFIHFEPTGEHVFDGEWEELDDFFPPYIVPGTPEQDHWMRQNPSGWKKDSPSSAQVTKLEGHVAAALGDVVTLEELAAENKRALHARDRNGWQPLHEAVRGGHIDAVRLLVEHGADINAVTNGGEGVSPYNIAIKSFSPSHPVAEFLESLGALNIGPEL